ncbi:MAG: 6,7-dimethyl-8-ribityllumazine synthase, partial [Planctomycetota bacterium]
SGGADSGLRAGLAERPGPVRPGRARPARGSRSGSELARRARRLGPEDPPGRIPPAVREFSGSLSGSGRRIGVVVARFHGQVAKRLLEGCLDALQKNGVPEDAITVVSVPGAFEVPLAAQRLAESGACDAIVAIGAIVRGETEHFDLIARECARGCAEVARETSVPVAFEVLACESMEDALARAGGAKGNRGFDAGLVALRMANLLREIPARGRG